MWRRPDHQRVAAPHKDSTLDETLKVLFTEGREAGRHTLRRQRLPFNVAGRYVAAATPLVGSRMLRSTLVQEPVTTAILWLR